jgi:tRNA wybutosine-synthesizing protein 3
MSSVNSAWRNHKQSVLGKEDKSFKQSVDYPIKELVNCINSSASFVTTSSCSGRIMLIHEGDTSKRKNGAEFLFVSHELIKSESAVAILRSCEALSGNVFLKLEPLILHIEAESLEVAIQLLHKAKSMAALKHSCIVSAINNKYIVCIKGMVKLEVPIVHRGDTLVTLDLFSRYLEIANERMLENFAAIDALIGQVSLGLLEKRPSRDIQEARIPRKLRPCLRHVNPEGLLLDPLERQGNLTEYFDIGKGRVRLDTSMKFGFLDTGEKLNIIPSSASRPVLRATSSVVIFDRVSERSVIFVVDSETWLLELSEDSRGWRKLYLYRLSVCGRTTKCFKSAIGAIILTEDSAAYVLEWKEEAHTSHKIDVGNFQRFGNCIRIAQELSKSAAETYADNMKADLIVKQEGYAPPKILFSRNGLTRVVHKESGISYVIDFSFDCFDSSLVNFRAKLRRSVEPQERILEIAGSVNCVSMGLSTICDTGRVMIYAKDERIRSLIGESARINSDAGLVVVELLEDISELLPVDRLIISDRNFDAKLELPIGVLHRNSKVHFLGSNETALHGLNPTNI